MIRSPFRPSQYFSATLDGSAWPEPRFCSVLNTKLHSLWGPGREIKAALWCGSLRAHRTIAMVGPSLPYLHIPRGLRDIVTLPHRTVLCIEWSSHPCGGRDSSGLSMSGCSRCLERKLEPTHGQQRIRVWGGVVTGLPHVCSAQKLRMGA